MSEKPSVIGAEMIAAPRAVEEHATSLWTKENVLFAARAFEQAMTRILECTRRCSRGMHASWRSGRPWRRGAPRRYPSWGTTRPRTCAIRCARLPGSKSSAKSRRNLLAHNRGCVFKVGWILASVAAVLGLLLRVNRTPAELADQPYKFDPCPDARPVAITPVDSGHLHISCLPDRFEKPPLLLHQRSCGFKENEVRCVSVCSLSGFGLQWLCD